MQVRQATPRLLSRLGLAALIGAAAVAVTGCGGKDKTGTAAAATEPAQGADTKAATIRFTGPETPETFAPVIKAFEQRNPKIKIKYTSVPFDQLNSVLQSRLSQKDPSIDVYTADQSRVPSLAARGYLEDLDKFKPQAQKADLATQVEASSYNGKLYSLPIWTSSQYLFYNKKLLQKAGIPLPSKDPAKRMTWEQLRSDGEKAQAAGAKWGLLFDQVDRYYQLQPLPVSAGGGSGLTGDNLLKPDVANPGWVKAMTYYHDLAKDGIQPKGIDAAQMGPLFAEGKAAFFVGGPWDFAVFGANKKLDFGFAPQPIFEGGKVAMPTDSWSWGINPASKNKDAAEKFLEFVSLTKEGSLASLENVFIIPANKEAFASFKTQLDAKAGSASAGAAELMQHELDNSTVQRPRSIGYTQFEDVMLKVFADIRNGADPKKRLEQANGQIEDALAPLQ